MGVLSHASSLSHKESFPMSTYTLDDLLMEAYLLGQDLWHDDNAMWKPTGALLIDLSYSLQCYMDNENV